MSDEKTKATTAAGAAAAAAAARELGLEPMSPLSFADVESTADLLRQLSKTAFTGRLLGEAVEVADAMLRDGCLVVLTLTGAMTMAGLNPLIIEMLERGWVEAIVSTGALVGHGLVEDLGLKHYKAKAGVSDADYHARRLNRVYDTIEPEDNLDALERQVRALLRELANSSAEPLGTHELLRFFGERLPGRGVLQTAAERDVPVYIPAFTDSELGLDFAVHLEARRQRDRQTRSYDGFRDLFHFRELCSGAIAAGRKLGIFTVGGGVPRNWAQQVGPYADIRHLRLGFDEPLVPVRYSYGVRICPDPVHYGHLSGCTYSEGVSWGKFVPASEGGRYAEVLLDATVGWPLLAQALIDRGL